MLSFINVSRQPGRGLRTGLLLNGLLSLLFGLLVFAHPELLAYLVAFFFVIVGFSLLLTWWRLRP